MAALHDEAAHEMHGCTPQDVYSIPTGRYGSSTLGRGHIPNILHQDDSSYSPAGSSHPIEIDLNDSTDIDIDDIDDCSSDQTTSCIFINVVDVGVQTDEVNITSIHQVDTTCTVAKKVLKQTTVNNLEWCVFMCCLLT